MTVAASVVEYAMALARAGTTAALALVIGTAENAANRVGLYSDLTASNEKLGLVIGGVTGPTFNRTGSQVIAAGLVVQDSTFAIADNGDPTKTITFQAASISSGFGLVIDAGAQAANRTLSVPVLTADATLMVLSETQTVSGAKTFSSASGVVTLQASTQDAIRILGRAGGTSSFVGTLTPTTLTASQTYTCPNLTGVVALSVASIAGTRIAFGNGAGLLTDDAGLGYSSNVLTVGSGAATSSIFLNTAAGNSKEIYLRAAGNNRWVIGADASAEAGADAGANFYISAKTDAGASIDSPFSIIRASGGLVTLGSAARVISLPGTTSAVSSIVGAVTFGNGTAATSVAVGGGNIFAGASISADGNISIPGATAGVGSNRLFQITRTGHTTGYNGVQFNNSGNTDTAAVAQQGSLTNAAINWATADTTFIYAPTRFRVSTGTNASNYLEVIGTTVSLGSGTALVVGGAATFSGTITQSVNDAATITQPVLRTLAHNSTGTPAAGFGTTELWTLESDTTADQSAFACEVRWATATHASRKSRAIFYVYDTAARDAIRIEASGSAPMIGFLGAAAVVRALMAAPTGTLTRTTFDTTTVTLPQLAERVAAMITDSRSYGLHG